MIAIQGTPSSTEWHVMGADIGHPLTLWAQTSQQKPGKMYQDRGCCRCVAGYDVHDVWQRYLSSQGLTPARLNKKEELIFGTCKVEISDCAFQYPFFFEGTLKGSIDVARIPVACPALFSKRMMRERKHFLDFEKQMTTIGAFKLQYPFENSVPILDIFQLPRTLNLTDIPSCFHAKTPRRVHQVAATTTGVDLLISGSSGSHGTVTSPSSDGPPEYCPDCGYEDYQMFKACLACCPEEAFMTTSPEDELEDKAASQTTGSRGRSRSPTTNLAAE